MTDAELTTEIELEIANITLALSHILKGGQSYTINSGGSTRTVTMADYERLTIERHGLRLQLKEIDGSAGLVLSAGW